MTTKYRRLTKPFVRQKGDQYKSVPVWLEMPEQIIGAVELNFEDWIYRRPIRTTTKKGKLK